MNGCPSESQWEAFVDGDLAPERNREFATHLETCRRCRALVDEMIALRAELGSLVEPELPADLEAKVMAAVRSERVPSPGAHLRTTLLASLFSIGVLAEAVFIVLKGYGVTSSDIAAAIALRWPGLFAALSAFTGWGNALGQALSSPRGWIITARVLEQTPWLWPACVTAGLGTILLVRRFHTVKGAEQK